MGAQEKTIITVNAGSSSIKLTAFAYGSLRRLCDISIDNIDQDSSTCMIRVASGETRSQTVHLQNHDEAIRAIIRVLAHQLDMKAIVAVGHRIVHSGPLFDRPIIVTAKTIEQLHGLVVFDPEHMPMALALIKRFTQHVADARQVACFDTTFFKELPRIARLLPLPRRFEHLGLRRYGFHGLSYEYLLQAFAEHAGERAAHGRVVLAHLGSGVSLTAVKDGKVLDTTMSLTPASGVLMSTRAGDIDPGIIRFLRQQVDISATEFDHMLHFESGLLGVSELSSDMLTLIQQSSRNTKATEAIDLFCYQVHKVIGSFTAVLGGLDSLIFSGGMGENAPRIRSQICANFDYLNLRLDKARNANGEFLISSDDSHIGVHVMHTDEAVMIARHTQELTNGLTGR